MINMSPIYELQSVKGQLDENFILTGKKKSSKGTTMRGRKHSLPGPPPEPADSPIAAASTTQPTVAQKKRKISKKKSKEVSALAKSLGVTGCPHQMRDIMSAKSKNHDVFIEEHGVIASEVNSKFTMHTRSKSRMHTRSKSRKNHAT